MIHTRRKKYLFEPERLRTLQYLDARAARSLAPIEPRSFYAAIAEGRLAAFRIGGKGKLVVKREDFERFLTAKPVENDLDKIVNETLAELGGGR